MKNILLMAILLLSGFLTSEAQTIITLSADQPALLEANAGNDIEISSGEAVMIGGSPSAIGGSEPYSHSWSEGINFISGEANPSVNPTESVTYTLVVTDNNACTAADSISIIISITGINDSETDRYMIYPNPSADMLTIDIGSENHVVSLISYDGNCLWTKQLNGITTFASPRIPGIYFLKIEAGDKESIIKIVISN
jgi:hypothetical protein